MYFGSGVVEKDLAARTEIGNLIFSALFFSLLNVSQCSSACV